MSNYNDVFGTATVPPAEYRFSSVAIPANETVQLEWPSNYSSELVGTVPAPALLHVAGGQGAELRLPPANETSVGQDLLVYNAGSYSVTIVDAEDAPITTLAAGAAKYLYTTDNSDPAGVWGVFTYGMGTSGADAVLLAGNGLEASSNKLKSVVSYRAINSNITLGESDRATLVDAQAGSLVVTLPSTLTAGFFVYVRNSSVGSITLQPTGSQTVDGQLALTLAPGESAQVLYTGSSAYWETVGYGRDATFVFSEVVIDASARNVTLSSSQVAGKMIRITGTAAANITVTLPPVDNILFVSVGSGMGSYQAIFTTGSGSTVTLPANQRTALYCDGTNVSTAITSTVASTLALNDGSAAAPTLFYAVDTDTGFYRRGEGSVSFTSNGVEKVRFTGDGVVLGTKAAYTVFTPAGSISSATVQLAIEEIDQEKQPLDATLTALAGVSTAADQLIYATGPDTFATTSLTGFARTLLDDVDADAARGTLGLGSMAVQAANGVSISGGSIAGITDLAVADGGTGASTAAGARTNLDVPARDGTGAVGTWVIDISGQATSAGSALSAIKLSQSTGAAPSYAARAWGNFDGTGTTGTNQTVRGHGNIASVFKNGTGDYTVNFDAPMPNANYAVIFGLSASTSGGSNDVANNVRIDSQTANSVRFRVGGINNSQYYAAYYDAAVITLTVFG